MSVEEMPQANDGHVRNLGGRPPRSSREAVVDTGLAILKADGLNAVTLSAVGQRLGLGKVAMYTYVASKEDLLLAMRDEVNRRQLEALRAEADLAPDLALKAICARLVDIMTDYGELMVTVAPDLTGPGLEVGEHFLEILARLGLAPEQQLQVWALLASVLHSFVARGLANGRNEAALTTAQVEEALARDDTGRFPRLHGLYDNAVQLDGAGQAAFVNDVLALVIDVLIPTLRERPETPGERRPRSRR